MNVKVFNASQNYNLRFGKKKSYRYVRTFPLLGIEHGRVVSGKCMEVMKLLIAFIAPLFWGYRLPLDTQTNETYVFRSTLRPLVSTLPGTLRPLVSTLPGTLRPLVSTLPGTLRPLVSTLPGTLRPLVSTLPGLGTATRASKDGTYSGINTVNPESYHEVKVVLLDAADVEIRPEINFLEEKKNIVIKT